jgi:hypothetical protein
MAESTPQIKAFLGFDGVGPRALTVRSKRNERSHSLTNEPSKDRQSHAPLRPLWVEGDPLLAQTGQDAQLTKKKPAVAPSAAVSQLGIQ